MGSTRTHHRVGSGELAASAALVLSAFAAILAVLGAATVPCSRFVEFFPLVIMLCVAGAARALGHLAIAQLSGAFSILLLLSQPDAEYMRLWLCSASGAMGGGERFLSEWGARSVWAIAVAHLLSRLSYSSSQMFVPVAGVFALGVAAANCFVAWVTRDSLGSSFHIREFEIGFLVSLGASSVIGQAQAWVGRRVGPLHASGWIIGALGLAAVTVSWTALHSRETFKRHRAAQTYLEQLQQQVLDRHKQVLAQAEAVFTLPASEKTPPASKKRGRGIANRAAARNESDALYALLAKYPALRAFYRVDGDGAVTQTYSLLLAPLNEEEADAGRAEISQTISRRTSGSSRFLKLSEDHLGLVRIPIPRGETLAAVVDRRMLASAMVGLEGGAPVYLAVDDGIDKIFFGKRFELQSSLATPIPDPSLPWTVYVDRDSPRFAADIGSRLPEAFLVVGLGFTALLTLLVHYLEMLRAQTKTVRRANQELRDSEDQLHVRAVELMEAREAALHASRMKTQFLAHLSHEIRTPLNAIVSAVELLSESARGARERSHAKTAVGAAELVVELLNETLDIARIECGNIDIQPVEFSPRKLAEASCALFSVHAKRMGIKVECTVGKEVPDWVEGDVRRVRQVLTNLISNSIKYTREGFVQLEVDVEHTRDQACVLRFLVRDSGQGIPGDEIPTLFHPFTRGTRIGNGEVPGSGLGLAISRQLVEKLNDSRLPASIPDGIQVQSTLGQGTRFWFFLAVKSLGKGRRKVVAVKPSRAKAKKGTSVLLVEDNEISRKVTGERLESLGLRVATAASGEDAFRMYQHRRSDVILMDCRLPGESGYQTAIRIREHEAKSELMPAVIIALTASAFAEDRAKCTEAGMDDYLSKPFRSETLSEKIVILLSARSKQQASKRSETLRPAVHKLMKKAGKGLSAELFEMFTRDVPMRLWSLHALRSKKDYDKLAEATHALKGIVADLGCIEMLEACDRIEQSLKRQNYATILDSILLLDKEYRLRVARWRSELKPRKRAA